MKSLDTNIVLRLILGDSPRQLKVIENIIDSAGPRSLFVADAVFFECAWMLSGDYYKFDRTFIAEALLQIASIPQIKCNKVLLTQAMPLYLNNKNISFIDACLSVYAVLEKATPLLSFDKNLANALPAIVQKP